MLLQAEDISAASGLDPDPPSPQELALLDPIGDARALLRRLQSNEMFQRYLRERSLYALPLVAGTAIAGLALAGGAMAFILGAGTLLAVVAMTVLVPIVLVGSVVVQAYVLLSWLEGRSLAKLQEHRRARDRGPAARWIARRLRIDMGPPPRVPWIPALALFVLPAAVLVSVAPAIAAGLALYALLAAFPALAQSRGLLCHVDACLGGFFLPFAKKLGRAIPPFDFEVRSRYAVRVRATDAGGLSVERAFEAIARWTGLRVRPERIEFWSGRPSRLHDREVYLVEPDGGWRVERLYP